MVEVEPHDDMLTVNVVSTNQIAFQVDVFEYKRGIEPSVIDLRSSLARPIRLLLDIDRLYAIPSGHSKCFSNWTVSVDEITRVTLKSENLHSGDSSCRVTFVTGTSEYSVYCEQSIGDCILTSLQQLPSTITCSLRQAEFMMMNTRSGHSCCLLLPTNASTVILHSFFRTSDLFALYSRARRTLHPAATLQSLSVTRLAVDSEKGSTGLHGDDPRFRSVLMGHSLIPLRGELVLSTDYALFRTRQGQSVCLVTWPEVRGAKEETRLLQRGLLLQCNDEGIFFCGFADKDFADCLHVLRQKIQQHQ
jgi:hypothetical protein